MLPSLSAWYWTKGGQGHAAVSVCLVLDIGWTGLVRVMLPSLLISLVLDIRWTGSVRVMLPSLLICLVLDVGWTGSC